MMIEKKGHQLKAGHFLPFWLYGWLNLHFGGFASLNPPYKLLSDVVYLPFKKNSFEIILCCEVLEHIPYSEFEQALFEIYRVSNEFAVISLPAPFVSAAMALNLPHLPVFKLHAGMRYFTAKKFDGQHYWELGRRGYPLKRIKNAMKNVGFNILYEFRPTLSLFCYFFVLKKL